MYKVLAIFKPKPRSRLSVLFTDCSQFLDEVNGKNVMEIGVGSGSITQEVLKRDAKFVLGTEISESFFTEAKLNLAHFNDVEKRFEIVLTQGDIAIPAGISALDETDGKFELVYWNPPQQPQPEGSYAGVDGELWIRKFLNSFDDLLIDTGVLYVTVTEMIDISKLESDYSDILNFERVFEKNLPMFDELKLDEGNLLRDYINSLKQLRGESKLGDTLYGALLRVTKK